jgi:hypothetical protein
MPAPPRAPPHHPLQTPLLLPLLLLLLLLRAPSAQAAACNISGAWYPPGGGGANMLLGINASGPGSSP